MALWSWLSLSRYDLEVFVSGASKGCLIQDLCKVLHFQSQLLAFELYGSGPPTGEGG